jgi:hypothetical protein
MRNNYCGIENLQLLQLPETAGPGLNMFKNNFRFVVALTMTIMIIPVLAQGKSDTPLLGPINSDPLTIRGISPRVLDIALFPMSQGLYWEMVTVYQSINEAGVTNQERFRLISDPYTEYGRDLFIEFESEPLRSLKEYKRSLEVTMGKDNFVRKEDRLYDPKSFRVSQAGEGHEIIAFRFDKARVPSSLRWLTLLAGEVHIIDGVLDRIEFTAEKTIERDGIRHRNFTSTVSFGAVEGHGGYVIDWIEEKFSFRKKHKLVDIHTWGRMLKYRHSDIGEIAWQQAPDELFYNKPANQFVIAKKEDPARPREEEELNEVVVSTKTRQEITDEFDAAETVRLDLRRKLPIWADDVRKLGFELPKTYGVGLIGLWQNADIDLIDIGVGGISVVDDIPLIDPLGSDFNSTITSLQLRGDFWLLPFVNLSVLAGNLKTDTDITLRFTPGFQALYKLKTGKDLPEFAQFPASTTAKTLGFGLTTGLQYENLIFSLSANYAWAVTNETNSEINTWVLLGLAGYDFGDIGMQVLTGVQYQKTDQYITGTIDPVEGQDPLEFSIGIGLEETIFLLGVNKDIGRNWTLTGMGGLNGTRKQLTVQFGYRW